MVNPRTILRLLALAGFTALAFAAAHAIGMAIGIGAFENAIPKSSTYPGLLAEFRQHLSRGAAYPAIAAAGVAWWGLARWMNRKT